jgi:hypothetical protein
MATGIRTTYGDTANIKRSIGDMIQFIDWTEAPLLRLFGTKNESKFRLVNWPSTKYEWLEDTMSARETTLAEVASAGETADIAVTDGSIFKEGDVLLCEDELMYVTSVATNDITVTRGFAGTTDAEHASGTALKLATIARLEGADYDTGHTTTMINPFNYTQILSEAVKVTGSEAVNSKYGVNDTMAYHLSKLMGGSNGVGEKFRAGKLPILLQQTFYHGHDAIGTASTARSMGGFEEFVTTNVTDLNSAKLQRSHIEDAFQACYLAGGDPDTIICNAWLRRKITTMYEGMITTTRSETRGGSRIDTVMTDFGEMEIMFDRWCPTDRLYIVESGKLGWIEYRPFQVFDRPSTGDYMVKEVLGEYGFVLVNEKSHAYIKEASTTS